MDTLTIILLGLVVLLYLKWILIILVFPFQVMHGQILRKWEKSKNAPLVYCVLDKPYNYWEKIFRKGWQRYMLFQISLVPSHHLRRFVYKALGAEIGKNVIFHFKTDTTHPVTIGDRAWIGSNAIILTGVNIGDGAVCCAGCVVIKDVEPYAVVAGIPAKKVNERPRDLQYEFKGRAVRLY